jgi:hypothetical protein
MDTFSHHINKKQTSALLQEIIQDLHLFDLASRPRKMQRAWYCTSRLGLILTNLPIVNLKYRNTITIFGNALVKASFVQKRQKTTPYTVLGSDNIYNRILQTLTVSGLLDTRRLKEDSPAPFPTSDSVRPYPDHLALT